MARYDGRLMAKGRQGAAGHGDKDVKTLATQVWVNDSVAVNDTFYFGKLPKGSIICGGRVYSGRLASGTSAGSCSFSFALGVDQILKNTSGTSYSVASVTSALGTFGPIDFNARTSNTPTATQAYDSGFSAPLGGLLLSQGQLTVTTDEGNVFATLTVSAGNGSGVCAYLNLELEYYTGTYT